jgi:hypothetical protein
MPTSIYSMLGIQGFLWGTLLLIEGGYVPIGIGLILGGAVMFVVWHRAWQRRS